MKTCIICEVEKPDDSFRPFARGRRKVCRECEGGGKAVIAEPVADAPADNLVTIEPSYGARLRIEGSLLELQQDRTGEDGETYTHTVTLYPHEARQVIDAISSFVEKAA